MKRIFQHIERKSQDFQRRPLFTYLKDEDIDERQRLSFVPVMAHFVMTFADLCRFFLQEPNATNRYQKLVNTHLSEETSHWKWFLADLKTLELNPTMEFTEALQLIWSEHTRKTRTLAYAICRLSGRLTPLEKLAMILAIEGTARVGLFGAAIPVGAQLEKSTGRRLVFFGGHHLAAEEAHSVESDDVHTSIESIRLGAKQVTKMKAVVDEVYACFAAFVDEAFEHVIDQQRLARFAHQHPARRTAPLSTNV